MLKAECSETSEHKIQMKGIHPKAKAQHAEYREGLKKKVMF
jgi:hypothetical protein